jgi:hypothetical protein
MFISNKEKKQVFERVSFNKYGIAFGKIIILSKESLVETKLW